MGNDVYKNAIKYLPTFFDNQVQVDTTGGELFKKLKNVVEFDEGYIFFLNPESIQLKYKFDGQNDLKIEDSFYINDKIKYDLFTLDGAIYDDTSPLINLLELSAEKSFLISKLAIRNTVYGFILLCKAEKSYYTEESVDIVNAVGSIVSYTIKDIELSNVFKIQLKALKDNILETNAVYKTVKEQNIKILEADRVKNEFLANISHELRTPLNAIIGFSEVLSAKLFGDLNEKQSEYVSDIQVSGIHLLGMINEILDISKLEAHAMSLNLTNFSITQAINEIVNVIKPLSDKKFVTVEKNIEEDREIFADFQKISQILYNLLSNAIKFSPENGKIEINVNFKNDKLGDKLVIKIKDNGIGIEEKYHGKIFGKFVQLASSYTKKESSTGLGLTITKQLVEMHGGHISLESEVDKGTTFVVEMPQRGEK